MRKQMDSKFFIIYSLMLVHFGILRKFLDSTSLFAPHADAVRIMRIILTVRLLRMMRLMQRTTENSMDAWNKWLKIGFMATDVWNQMMKQNHCSFNYWKQWMKITHAFWQKNVQSFMSIYKDAYGRLETSSGVSNANIFHAVRFLRSQIIFWRTCGNFLKIGLWDFSDIWAADQHAFIRRKNTYVLNANE